MWGAPDASRRDVMGAHRNRPLTAVLATAGAIVVLALNVVLVMQELGVAIPGLV